MREYWRARTRFLPQCAGAASPSGCCPVPSGASHDLRMSGFTPQTVVQTPPQPNFMVAPSGTSPSPGTATGADSAQAAAFRAATSALFASFEVIPVDPPKQASLDLAALRTTL